MIAVGVDAGGSGTTAFAERENGEVRCVRGGPANASSRGVDAVVTTIAEVVERACGGASASLAPFTLFVGAAGAGRPAIAHALEEGLRMRFPHARSVRVEDDVIIAARAALPEGSGIALIAGTGSIAYAEHGSRRVRIGGAGYLLGDEGSGFAIGLAALRAVVRAFDGLGRADAISAMVAREYGIAEREELLAAVYAESSVDVARIAGLAPHLLALAGEGDRGATKIVQTAAKELGDLVCAAARQADLLEASPLIAFCGGLLRENSLLTYVLQTRLQADIPGSSIIRPTVEPAQAALCSAHGLSAASPA